MAECLSKKGLESKEAAPKNDEFGDIECAVCLQTCMYPAKLPCGHIFCYLCIKGIVNQGSNTCAMCRRYIPVDYLDNPVLLRPDDLESTGKAFEDGHLWFYEGRNGWWQYDERNNAELESSYQKKDRNCELLIAGFLYVADFDTMLQYRKNDPSKKRRIKRDISKFSLGVAGLKTVKNTSSHVSNAPDLISNTIIQNLQNLHISERLRSNNTSNNNNNNNHESDNEPYSEEISSDITYPFLRTQLPEVGSNAEYGLLEYWADPSYY